MKTLFPAVLLAALSASAMAHNDNVPGRSDNAVAHKDKVSDRSDNAVTMGVNAEDRSDSVRYEHEARLNEVIVTGLTGHTLRHNLPAPVSVVTQKDLQQTLSTNIVDAIARQPGVDQITTGSGISKPVIRGLGYNRVVVVNDGVRQEGQQWGDEHGLEIDPEAVGSVEILKGPASLMYGSDAMAGVLVMHRPPLPAEGTVKAGLTTGYQTNNGLFNYSVNAAGQRGGLLWSSRWSQKLAHAYKNPVDGYVYGSGFREKAFTQLLGVNKEWGQSLLTMSYYNLTPSMAEGEAAPEDYNFHAYGHTMPYQQIHHYKVVSDNTFVLGDGSLKAVVGYQQNRRQEFEDEETPDTPGLDFRLHTVTADVRYTSPESGDGWKWVAGAAGMYQQSQNEGTEFLVPAYRLVDYGAFATVSKDASIWHLSGGLRLDRRHLDSDALFDDGEQRFEQFSRNFTGLSASLGTVVNLGSNANIKINLSHGFRAPNISELGSNGEHEGTGRYETGNSLLKAETSWQADLGFDFSTSWLYLEASAFANRIGNYIFIERVAEKNIDGQPVYQYTQGDARLLGGELLADIHPAGWVHFENTFSVVDAIQMGRSGGERYLPFIPAPRFTSNLRFDIARATATAFSIGLENYFRQSHARTVYDTETVTPGYTLLNASFSTDIVVKGRRCATVVLSAENITNKGYQSHLSRLKYIGLNAQTGRMGLYNMGRNIGLKLIVPIL